MTAACGGLGLKRSRLRPSSVVSAGLMMAMLRIAFRFWPRCRCRGWPLRAAKNEKTPKVNQGLFKRDWIGFSGCSIN